MYVPWATRPITPTRTSVRQHFPHKPFVISETGAGGIFEWSHNLTAATWTTKYQAEVLSRDVDAALASEYLSGVSLFQFFDIKEVAALESDEKRKLRARLDAKQREQADKLLSEID